MKRSISLFALLLVVSISTVLARPLAAQDRAAAQPSAAQAPQSPQAPATMQIPPPASPQPPPGQGRNVQVDVTITLQGGSTPASKKMTLVAVENTDARGRSGIEVAVPTSTNIGASAAGVTPFQSYSYRSVGLNVDIRPRIGEGGRIQLAFKLEFSAVLKPEGTGPGMPAFSKGNTDLMLVLESGKPLIITQSADAELGRGYTVEIKATVLR
jgi:hypothetical protein